MSNDSSQAPDEELGLTSLADVVHIAEAEGGARGKNLRAAAATTAVVAAVAIGIGTYFGTQSNPTAGGVTVDGVAAAATASAVSSAPTATATATGTATVPGMIGATAYNAYIAAAGGNEVASLNTQTGVPGPTYTTDTAMGVALSPNDQTLYVADTGQFGVLSVDLATKKSTKIEVGAYPQDVAVSPNGATVYATLTGGDTGVGGSSQVAVINTATNAVTTNITVGTAPRQIVLSTDGTRAYVSTEQGIYVIDTTKNRAVGVVHTQADVQGLALSPDGSTLYATAPDEGRLLVVSTRGQYVERTYNAGAEPWSVGVTPDGAKLYVADINSNSVAVIDPRSGRTLTTVTVGSLPTAIGVTPDGSQVWVGNTLTGSLSVISTGTDKLIATVPGGPGTTALDSAPTDIVFAPIG